MRINARKFLEDYFYPRKVLFTNSGGASLQAMIEDFKLQNSVIILPSFICPDVFVPLFIHNNIRPLLIDCPKDSFNIRLSDIKKTYEKDKNKDKIKSVLIVHTYGLINRDIEKISEWCKRKKIVLIEDCAHCINAKYKGKFVGKFGDAATFSLWKIMKIPAGGCYVRNNGEMNVNVIPYRINNVDINRLIRIIPFGMLIIKFLKSFNVHKKVIIHPSIIKVMATPKVFDFITINSRKIDINRRKQFASVLYNCLKREIPDKLPKLELSGNFFHSVPLLVKNQDIVFEKLLENKINCGRMWNNPLSKDPLLLKRWKVGKTPNVENYHSKKIINLMIEDPKFSNKQIEKMAKKISDVIKKYD